MQEKKKYPRSIALERRVEVYPRPAYFTLIEAYAKETGETKSAVVCSAVKLFFDSLPQERRQRLMSSKNNF